MNTRCDFDEGYANPHVDPLDSQTMDFDFAAIEGEIEGLGDENRGKLAQVVRRIFQFVCVGSLNGRTAPLRISRRFLAVSWVLDPSLIEGTPSAAELARRIGCPPSRFHMLTGAVTREFKITNRAQRHGDGQRKEAHATG